ncbi:hypothetical protein HPB47_024485 [Ixodes persulcatus]|uniref:Uncharacterized protein n=1 Tax=Ixodes persulcatus TaxID=34615 RepID=A0AC60Q6A0_IXOPE|nr:hypothetical protein HPB47_024485 [Ixodes persulcatus]
MGAEDVGCRQRRREAAARPGPIQKTEAAWEAVDGKETDVVFIPNGCTCILRPADECRMKPFKDALGNRWSSSLREGIVTAKGNLKKPSRQDIVGFMLEARASPSEDTVPTSFERCGISVGILRQRRLSLGH